MRSPFGASICASGPAQLVVLENTRSGADYRRRSAPRGLAEGSPPHAHEVAFPQHPAPATCSADGRLPGHATAQARHPRRGWQPRSFPLPASDQQHDRSTVGRSSMTPLGRTSQFPGVRAGRSGIGAKASSDKQQCGPARHRSGLVKGDVAALRLAEPPRWHY